MAIASKRETRAAIAAAVEEQGAATQEIAPLAADQHELDFDARAFRLEQLLLEQPAFGVQTLILERRDSALSSRDVRTVLGE